MKIFELRNIYLIPDCHEERVLRIIQNIKNKQTAN